MIPSCLSRYAWGSAERLARDLCGLRSQSIGVPWRIRLTRLLATLNVIGLVWQLRAVPDCYDPYRVGFDPVEEAVRRDDDLAEGKLRKLGQRVPESGKSASRKRDAAAFWRRASAAAGLSARM